MMKTILSSMAILLGCTTAGLADFRETAGAWDVRFIPNKDQSQTLGYCDAVTYNDRYDLLRFALFIGSTEGVAAVVAEFPIGVVNAEYFGWISYETNSSGKKAVTREATIEGRTIMKIYSEEDSEQYFDLLKDMISAKTISFTLLGPYEGVEATWEVSDLVAMVNTMEDCVEYAAETLSQN